MRETLSNFKNFLAKWFKRRHRELQLNGGTSTSAATDALALSSPPSLQPENLYPQTVEPHQVQSEIVQSQEFRTHLVQSKTTQSRDAQRQEAQSVDAPLQTVSEAATPLIRQESGPWALAFSMVRKRESELMLAYEEYLSSLQGDTAASVDLSFPESIKSIVNRAIQDREEKKWHVSLIGMNVEVRKQAERLAKLLLWSDPIVKSAVSSQPYAALAWSGVSILLPLVTSGITQNEAMLKGFSSIGDVQMYWRICEETHLPSLNGTSHRQIIEPLARLYSYVIEYQARVICHLSKNQLRRAWSDISSPGEWDAKTQEIDRLNEECRNILGLLNATQIEKQWKAQLDKMQESQTFLDKICHTLVESSLETWKHHEDQRVTDLLQDLASDYQGHKDFNPPKVQGTCEWFFSDERFRNWRDSGDSRLLWVSAGPGCGKSVLSRALIDERRLSTSVTTSTICYFFFKDGDEGRMYAHNALCAILHQLFKKDLTGDLIEQALTSHKNFGKTLTGNFSELWELLLRCADSSHSGEVICLIDALDECDEESREQLIKGLKSLYMSSSEGPSRLKFLITSRPYLDIEASFRRFSNATTYLRFDGDDKSREIGDEINLVIDARVDEFAQDFNDKDRRLIANRLKSMENRTYLWLHLTLDIIKKSPSEYGRRVEIEELLSSLPTQVSEAYDKILDKGKRRDYTEALLQIILAATRPLSLEEANYALTVAAKQPPFESYEALQDELWPSGTFKEHVKNLCGLFINVYDGKLSFIHQTAREFLLHPEREGNWKGRFTMPKSHSIISLACLRYLLMPDVGRSQRRPNDEFLSYAANSWCLHYKSQGAADAHLYRKDARMLCNGAQVWAPYMEREWGEIDYMSLPALTVAASLGLNLVVQDILPEEAGDAMSSVNEALWHAARNNHIGIVQMLLDHGADARGNRLALDMAARGGHTEIIHMLLDHGADARGNRRALDIAARGGHTEIVRMLLDHGADVSGNLEALESAAMEGHTEIVCMLLNHGADVRGKFEALENAAMEGHTEIVCMLLNHGADVNGNLEALKNAVINGHTEIVHMLLDHGADA